MDTFCVLPWFGREIGFNMPSRHCCLLPIGSDIKKIQREMLAGQRPLECQKCWNLEAQNIPSDRQLKNSALDFYWDRDLEFIKQDAALGTEKILMLKLITSNTCNATCISCNSFSSSSWEKLTQSNRAKEIKIHPFINLDNVLSTVNFSELKMLSLIGGEPLFESRNFDILQQLIAANNTNCFISVVTNGSVKLSKKYLQVLSKFKNLNFCVSIDGTESTFEYLRFPLKWDRLQLNLKLFKTLTDNVSANYTISNLNIIEHNKTVAWFNENQIPYANNPIYNPLWLQPRALPLHIKPYLRSELTPADYQTYIGEHCVNDDVNYQEFLKQIKQQDQLKKISIQSYLPKFCQLLGNPFTNQP